MAGSHPVHHQAGLKMEPTGEVEEKEAKEQLVTVNGKGDDRGQAGNNWRDSHKRGMENHP